jgi:hypothetical protein
VSSLANRSTAWVASICLVALGGLAGCGSTSKAPVTVSTPPVILDTARVEQAIERSVLSQRHVQAKASCPSGVIQRKGLTFPCVVTYPGGTTTFIVNQLDDKGNVHYQGQ